MILVCFHSLAIVSLHQFPGAPPLCFFLPLAPLSDLFLKIFCYFVNTSLILSYPIHHRDLKSYSIGVMSARRHRKTDEPEVTDDKYSKMRALYRFYTIDHHLFVTNLYRISMFILSMLQTANWRVAIYK